MGIQRRPELSGWVLWDEPSRVKRKGPGQIKTDWEVEGQASLAPVRTVSQITGWAVHHSSSRSQAGPSVFGLLTPLSKLPASVIKHSAECGKSS